MINLQYNPPSGPTFIHVFGESVQDASRWRCVKKFHGTTKNLLEKFLMEPRGGTQSTLENQKITRWNMDLILWHSKSIMQNCNHYKSNYMM